MAQERIDRLLGETGRWSRSEARELVRRGQVLANGAVVRRPDAKVETDGLRLTVSGEAVRWCRYVYLLMNKPAGVLTATEDRRERTVLDLLPAEYRRRGVSPVGRLDKDTEGLLLLTDDGKLHHRLLSPKSHVDKVYLAQTEGTVDGADVSAFQAGLALPDGTRCLPAGLMAAGENLCLVTLHEGKYHQVKRMLAARGKPVVRLRRISFGPVSLGEGLASGAWRELSREELDALEDCCGAAAASS